MKFIMLNSKNLIQGILILALASGLIACGDDEEINSVSIAFVEANPTSITLQGTGGAGLSETSIVKFIIKDPEGTLLEGQIVNLSLSTTVGGITLNPSSVTSDINGEISTVVQSGSIPTPVRVIASIPGTDITTQSDQLAITSGIPDQNSTTVGASILNPEGYNISGTEITVTMRLADAFNNPVPAGTSASFTTEGGSIDGNCITNINGACSVTWRSQNPLPGSGGDGVGIVTILGTALGQESFIDNNANGVFDAGDFWEDIGEAYRDDNNNGSCDAGEFFEDINSNGLCDGPDGLYNGNACRPGYSLCAAQKNVHVRDSARIAMSTSFANITLVPDPGLINVVAGASVIVTIADLNGNSMPGNSAIEVSVSNGEIQNASSIPDKILNTILPLSFPVVIGTDGTSSNDGVLTIKITSPAGHITTFVRSITD